MSRQVVPVSLEQRAGHTRAGTALLAGLTFLGAGLIINAAGFAAQLWWLEATDDTHASHAGAILSALLAMLPLLPVLGFLCAVLYASLSIMVGAVLAAVVAALTRRVQFWAVPVIAVPCTAAFVFQFHKVLSFDPEAGSRAAGILPLLPLASLLGSQRLFRIVLRRQEVVTAADRSRMVDG